MMTLDEAIKILYEARRDGTATPHGHCRSNIWYPSRDENADGYTNNMSPPTQRCPDKYLRAARTLKHIKALARVRPDLVMRWAKTVVDRQKWRPTGRATLNKGDNA